MQACFQREVQPTAGRGQAVQGLRTHPRRAPLPPPSPAAAAARRAAPTGPGRGARPRWRAAPARRGPPPSPPPPAGEVGARGCLRIRTARGTEPLCTPAGASCAARPHTAPRHGAPGGACPAHLRLGHPRSVQLQHRLVEPLLQGGVRRLHGCGARRKSRGCRVEGMYGAAGRRVPHLTLIKPLPHKAEIPAAHLPSPPGRQPRHALTSIALERVPVPHHLGVVAALGVVVLPAQQAHLLAQAGGLVGLHGAVALRGLHLGLPAGSAGGGLVGTRGGAPTQLQRVW